MSPADSIPVISAARSHAWKVSGQASVTPMQVLKELPPNATPEQQDSAIQRNISPAPIIHWSTRPDTLHLPGQPVGKSIHDVSLPMYYKESFFSKDSLFHAELPGGQLGVAGDPVPYTIAGDNLLTSLLLGCFILATVAFVNSRSFICRQAKNFFFPTRPETVMTETSNEFRYQFFFILQTCLLFAIGYFLYTRSKLSDTFIIDQYQVIGIYTGTFLLYFLVKGLAYWFVNWIFFNRQKNGQWFHTFSFLVSGEGIAIFPMTMLMAYFGLPLQTGVFYAVIVVVLFKLLTFYKTYLIFFRRIDALLQIILYFCALEVIPLFALWGVLVIIGNYLKINF